ncbi:MAG: hypothetical protein OXU73_00770 [Candidatus Campbellbacteria bacterium]|nr:hypothetical protein [Candidatus Campbellbacteria bacterium]
MKKGLIITIIILFVVFIILSFVAGLFYKEVLLNFDDSKYIEYDSEGNIIYVGDTPPPPPPIDIAPTTPAPTQPTPKPKTPITTSKPVPDSYVASRVPPTQSKDRPTVILEEGEGHWVDRHGIIHNKAKISVRNDTIEFIGPIDRKSYADFADAINRHNKRIKTLIINSDGGNTKHGKYMGHWVYDNEIDVRVRTLCFSSCANYIFPAGDNKYIEAGAQIGWHGNVLGQLDGISEEEAIRRFREVVRKQIVEELKLDNVNIEEELKKKVAEYKQDLKNEVAFYKKIGVNSDVSNYFSKTTRMSQHEIDRAAALNALTKTTQEDFRVDGHTFSIESMKHFGINNVTYLGTDRFPQTPLLRTEGKIFLLELLP